MGDGAPTLSHILQNVKEEKEEGGGRRGGEKVVKWLAQDHTANEQQG